MRLLRYLTKDKQHYPYFAELGPCWWQFSSHLLWHPFQHSPTRIQDCIWDSEEHERREQGHQTNLLPTFLWVQDCLWNIEEHNASVLNHPVPCAYIETSSTKDWAWKGTWTFCYLPLFCSLKTSLFRTPISCSLPSKRQSGPILKEGAAGQLEQLDQLDSLSSVMLLDVPETVSSNTKTRSNTSLGLSLRR